ncbi:hypothetical protein N3K66_000979 [Trichothecium roseum]|uniref:Uncharacterized protein n=1 Tax=Trichothecium roseum TaxID=47278 RepID=A0ACC0VDF3_9HYPO|nr:hypothetical protein N3K66_000979 [Trichothecium roseum]
MKTFSAVLVALAAAGVTTVSAAPAAMEDRQAYVPCTGLYGTAQCCATDVLGVADLDCAQPPKEVDSADTFSSVCAAIGQRARCCVLPILEQGVLCNTPQGVDD